MRSALSLPWRAGAGSGRLRTLHTVAATVCLALLALVAEAAADGPPVQRVRRIIVDVRPIFDSELDPDFTEAPYTWANEIKIPTYAWIVRREVLLTPGTPVDERLLRESERNIRALGFLRDVTITVRVIDERHVDLLVRAQETWTFQPHLNIAFGGGSQTSTVGLTEKNLFGLGNKWVAEWLERMRLRRVPSTTISMASLTFSVPASTVTE